MIGIKQKYQVFSFQTEQTVNRKKSGFRAAHVKLLVEYGASTEVKNQNGEKPSEVAHDIVIKNCLLQSLETMVHSNKK